MGGYLLLSEEALTFIDSDVPAKHNRRYDSTVKGKAHGVSRQRAHRAKSWEEELAHMIM